MRERTTVGIILVLLGIGFLLDQFGVISFNDLWIVYWPLILIIIGGLGLLKRDSSKIIASLLLILGILFQSRNLGFIEVDIFKVFWPIALIAVGISIILPKNNTVRKNRFKNESEDYDRNINYKDIIDEFVIMGGIEISVKSQEFKGGKITAIMGGAEIDLREAKLYKNKAKININSLMGGIDIYVPDNWRIEHSGTPIMGGFKNKKESNHDAGAPTLEINFSAIMGGVEIK